MVGRCYFISDGSIDLVFEFPQIPKAIGVDLNSIKNIFIIFPLQLVITLSILAIIIHMGIKMKKTTSETRKYRSEMNDKISEFRIQRLQ